MATPAHDKYFLKTLHEEIDLFDRKLAHLEKYDSFNSDADRKASAAKMNTKRETLARTARKLVSEGIEFKASDLPRSFRTPESATHASEEAKPLESTTAEAVISPTLNRSIWRCASPFAGTVLDGQASVEAYKRARSKPGLSHA